MSPDCKIFNPKNYLNKLHLWFYPLLNSDHAGIIKILNNYFKKTFHLQFTVWENTYLNLKLCEGVKEQIFIAVSSLKLTDIKNVDT